MMGILKKNWKNTLFLIFVGLLLIPKTAMPIKVFVNRLIAFSPSEVNIEERLVFQDYNWNLTNLDNRPLNFSRSEGKVVIVNLWATWCPPCIAEMPSFQKLFDVYGDRVDFYFITNESNDRPAMFLKENNFDFPVYIASDAGPEALRSRSIPASYVISKGRTVVINEKGAANWNSDKVHTILDRLLAE